LAISFWLRKSGTPAALPCFRVIKHPSSNSENVPVISDGWVMVPVELADDMIAAAMNCDDVLFNRDESFCVQFGNIYAAMIAAAPQQEAE
ncbi:hypothetical protein ACVEP3_004135, partial [Salmonella enterica subsp. enterica serovar Cerro]